MATSKLQMLKGNVVRSSYAPGSWFSASQISIHRSYSYVCYLVLSVCRTSCTWATTLDPCLPCDRNVDASVQEVRIWMSCCLQFLFSCFSALPVLFFFISFSFLFFSISNHVLCSSLLDANDEAPLKLAAHFKKVISDLKTNTWSHYLHLPLKRLFKFDPKVLAEHRGFDSSPEYLAQTQAFVQITPFLVLFNT